MGEKIIDESPVLFYSTRCISVQIACFGFNEREAAVVWRENVRGSGPGSTWEVLLLLRNI